MPANGFGFAGPHHEIYLSDARRVAPEKLKTILRQPVWRLEALCGAFARGGLSGEWLACCCWPGAGFIG
jgi:hypothetical protein